MVISNQYNKTYLYIEHRLSIINFIFIDFYDSGFLSFLFDVGLIKAFPTLSCEYGMFSNKLKT